MLGFFLFKIDWLDFYVFIVRVLVVIILIFEEGIVLLTVCIRIIFDIFIVEVVKFIFVLVQFIFQIIFVQIVLIVIQHG